MTLGRREFLKLMGVTASTAWLAGCGREWSVPDRLVELALRGPGISREMRTICGLCEGACGLTVRLVDGLPVGLKGSPRHPLNLGGLCPVGLTALDVLYAPERVKGPLRRKDDRHQDCTWEEAYGEIAAGLKTLQDAGRGTQIVVLAEESSQLFHDLAERFTHGLGSTSFARLGDAQKLAYRLTQGIEEVPGFDLANADLVFSFGLNLFEDGPAPVYTTAAMIGRRPTQKRATLLYAGTRLSPSAAKAAEHVLVRPGTHGALALGIAHALVREGRYDREFVAKHTFGFEDWVDDRGRQRLGFRRFLLERYYPDRVAQLCGCDPSIIARLARRFAEASTPVAVAGGEATSGSNATATSMAVHAINALVGAFGRPGGVVIPPSIPFTPLEPIAVPGVASADSLLGPDPQLGGFGIDPIEALTERMLNGSHAVEVLFILNTNPMHDSMYSDRLRQAIERIPMVVSVSPFLDETAALADFVLPSHLFLESWQAPTTPSSIPVSVLGLAGPVVEPFFDTRQTGDILLELARRVGGPLPGALPWPTYVDYLKHRVKGLAASGQGAVISGSFEESWIQFLEERGWRIQEPSSFDRYWDDLVKEAGWWDPVVIRGDWARLFRNPTRRFEFFSRTLEKHRNDMDSDPRKATTSGAAKERERERSATLTAEGDEAFLPHFEPPVLVGEGELTLLPFRPITGRGRFTAMSPMLLEMFGYSVLSGWETWVELARETAHEFHIEEGDEVELRSDRGTMTAVVRIQPSAVPRVAYVPMALGHLAPRGEVAVGSNPADVLIPVRDPLSGALSTTSTRVSLKLIRRRRHGGPAPMEEGRA